MEYMFLKPLFRSWCKCALCSGLVAKDHVVHMLCTLRTCLVARGHGVRIHMFCAFLVTEGHGFYVLCAGLWLRSHCVHIFCTSLRCLDDCAALQLDTVTFRPAPSSTVTFRSVSCCSLATQLQLYDKTPDFSSRVIS
jgi:hypothetical protein